MQTTKRSERAYLLLSMLVWDVMHILSSVKVQAQNDSLKS